MGEAAALLLCGECGLGGCEDGGPWCGGGSGEGMPPPGGIRCGESISLAGDTFPDLAG